MVYGYVRHSLNNQKFIDQQIEQLQNSNEKPDEIVVETNRNEQMHKLIEKINEGDKIVTVGFDRFSTMSEEDFSILREKEIEIRTLNGYHSSYKHSDGSSITMLTEPLWKTLCESFTEKQEDIDKYVEEHPEEFKETEE